jgi:AcrR family transcriptional regulator
MAGGKTPPSQGRSAGGTFGGGDEAGAGLSSKARVLQIANAMHIAKPAADIRIADIARDAGVSPALVIVHYKSKDELLFAAYLGWLRDDISPAMDAFIADNPDADPVRVLMALWRISSRAFHRVRDMVASSYWWTLPEAEAFTAGMAPVRTHLADSLRRESPDASEIQVQRALELLQASFDFAVRRYGSRALDFDAIESALRESALPTLSWLRSIGSNT